MSRDIDDGRTHDGVRLGHFGVGVGWVLQRGITCRPVLSADPHRGRGDPGRSSCARQRPRGSSRAGPTASTPGFMRFDGAPRRPGEPWAPPFRARESTQASSCRSENLPSPPRRIAVPATEAGHPMLSRTTSAGACRSPTTDNLEGRKDEGPAKYEFAGPHLDQTVTVSDHHGRPVDPASSLTVPRTSPQTMDLGFLPICLRVNPVA